MADITMCPGGDCQKKQECYRHTATPNEYRQAYFVAPPAIVEQDGKQVCEMFGSNAAYVK